MEPCVRPFGEVKMLGWRCVCLPLLLAFGAPPARPATYHVSVVTGKDAGSGASKTAAFQTIQKACDTVGPGDTVIVHPGVYFENVTLRRAGTVDKPITFKTDAPGQRGRVVVTLANADVREKRSAWTLEDAALNLYAVPLGHLPARVLYDGVDLFPYPSVAALRRFLLADDYPAPHHGFAFDAAAKKLYVRLHAPQNTRVFAPAGVYGQPRFPALVGLGKYGSVDPNQHTMSVSPRPGAGTKGNYLDRPDCANWNVLTDGPAHVVLDGFTFETPAVAGVYVRGSHVTIRNAYFVGCKAGVAGGSRTDNDRFAGSNDITVEFCDYSQFPTYDDAAELIALHADEGRFAKNRFFWWGRKGEGAGTGTPPPQGYEIGGLALGMGANWTIRNCHVRDCFDGLSFGAMDTVRGARIHHNRFERIVDNAIETENHAADVRIYANEFVDCYMPISYQPMGGMPWPGPVFVYRNLIWDTQAHAALWRRAGWPAAWLKVGIAESNWKGRAHMTTVPRGVVSVPGAGFVVFNNTVVLRDGYFLERANGHDLRLKNFRFYNNLFVTQPLHGEHALPPDTGADWEFARNLYAPPRPSLLTPPAGKMIAGPGGQALSSPEALGLSDPWNNRFALTPGSPAVGAGMLVPGEPDALRDIGAIPFGAAWSPPPVGPQPALSPGTSAGSSP